MDIALRTLSRSRRLGLVTSTMEYAKLGATGVEVSRICLGTVFRAEPDEQNCCAVIAKAIDLGCNFLDCANVYRNGLSEDFVGKAIKGMRQQLVITTKVGALATSGSHSAGLSRCALMREAEASLLRLKTDYIDLYLCHFPDPGTPLEETLRAMDDLVRQGKIRYPGCSNFPAWQLCESLWISDRAGLISFACNQALYNLLDRRIEDELMPFCAYKNVALTVYASTAIGLLSGHCRYGHPPPARSPWDSGPYNYRAAMTRRTDEVVQTLIDIARKRSKTPIQVAIAWCLSRPQVTSVIVGADTMAHVEEDFGAAGWQLAEGEMAQLEEVSAGMRMVLRKDAPEGYIPKPLGEAATEN